jgi:hypothetical protein
MPCRSRAGRRGGAAPGVVGEPDELLDRALAAVVGRVRLARDDDLDGPLGVQQQLGEPVGSRSIRVSRLYDGTRRAKPMVRTSGSRTESIQPSSAVPAPRCRQEAYSRRAAAASATSCLRRVRRSSHSSPSGRWPNWRAPRRVTSGATQVGAWTPLVIEVIGTSSASKPGQRPANISRLTWPCRVETPLARWASRSPMTAMLKRPGRRPGRSRRRGRGSARRGRRAARRRPRSGGRPVRGRTGRCRRAPGCGW